MSVTGILAGAMAVAAPMMMIPPWMRSASYTLNNRSPNLIRDPAMLIATKLRGEIEPDPFYRLMRKQGFAPLTADNMYKLTKQLLGGLELISLERRGVIEEKDVDERAALLGWTPETIDELYQLIKVIPSAGDIIRYAVREVYTPDIAKAFGQFDELGVSAGDIDGVLSGAITDPTLDPDGVLAKAKADLKATGMTPGTFTKEWGAHWLLPAVIQGFEMLHRGVIPFKSTATQPLSLERLMIALDIMPAWREPLTAISYNPFTRVDVRRMHKTGVLDDEAVFTAYADVGFSPFAPGHAHDTVADAYACPVCRSDSKVGQMLDFTIAYNYRPPEAEKDEKDKERDLTKSDILTGLRDGLLEESEATGALGLLGYDADEVAYYLAKIEYQRDKDELSDSTHYLHDAYIKGVITFAEVTDELGKLNLPSKMTEYYLKVWDLEKIARTNKPTKSELMTFWRKKIIDEVTWRAEMVGLGYPNRYIDWYAAGEVEAS